MVFQGRLQQYWRIIFIVSHLSYTSKFNVQCQAIVKVHGVFPSSRGYTASSRRSISLSLGWRQPGHHYAIRAGRNLPDKEFRYLRTVIVNGRRLLGLQFKASPQGLTSPLNLPAPGRRQPLYSPYGFAETCVFVKQSLGPIHCGLLS